MQYITKGYVDYSISYLARHLRKEKKRINIYHNVLTLIHKRKRTCLVRL